ncbi:hypothetical protein V7O62_08660 [Methanolobus sp. ZRKC2]|uniref:hypothetical protein n=1 Tax=Methanolobus sp. ZRKC2 TaxID=3125783 RepID=UPI00324C1087
MCVKMAPVYTTSGENNHLPSKAALLQKRRSDLEITFDFNQNCLNHDLVYLKGNEGSCYWVDSKGLSMHFCGVDCAEDLSLEDLHSVLAAVLESVSFFDGEHVLGFARKLMSKIKAVFDMEVNFDESIDIQLGWKSIALLILSSNHSSKAVVGVRIGSGEYNIFC